MASPALSRSQSPGSPAQRLTPALGCGSDGPTARLSVTDPKAGLPQSEWPPVPGQVRDPEPTPPHTGASPCARHGTHCCVPPRLAVGRRSLGEGRQTEPTDTARALAFREEHTPQPAAVSPRVPHVPRGCPGRSQRTERQTFEGAAARSQFEGTPGSKTDGAKRHLPSKCVKTTHFTKSGICSKLPHRLGLVSGWEAEFCLQSSVFP